jgi:hypothetical protein
MHKITTDKKPKNSPFYGKGSESCFFLNNIATPLLKLEKGKKYKFELDCKEHKFVIATDEKLENSLFDPIDEGQFIFDVKSNYPHSLYYGCTLHPQEGGPIEICSEDSVTLNIVNLRKTIRNPVAIKSFRDNIIIGLESGTFYKCDHENKVAQVFGLKAILDKPVKLLDFVVVDRRIYSLISGHKDGKLSLIEVANFDGREEDFQSFDLQDYDGSSGILAVDTSKLYLLVGKTLYKIDIGNSGEYKELEIEKLDRDIKCLKINNDKVYLFDSEIIRDKKNIHKLNFVPTCIEFVQGKEETIILYADINGNLALAHDKEDIKAGWRTNSLKGIKSLLYHNKMMYVLINNNENKVEIWQLEY